MKKILQQAKKLVIPSTKIQKEKTQIARLAYKLVSQQISKYPEVREVEFGGSYAKGTWLPDRADIDIFIKFEHSTSDKKFTDISKEVGFEALKKFKPYVRYSDHPYVEATIKTTKVNVVPCYIISKGKWKSAADRSQFHTQFMLESLSGPMKNEVRLLKKFLKINGIYGSEIARQGLSGYVSEVLVYNYGSFENVIKSISKIKANEVIGKTSKKFDTSIVIMDPIDSNRNLAAAISNENIGRFVLACRAFRKNPSLNYFKQKKVSLSKNVLKNVLVVEFKFKARSPDIIWGQIKRASNSISNQLDLNGFKVLRNSAATDEKHEAAMIFLLESFKISESYVREGPEFFNESDSMKFISKNIKKTRLLWIGKNNKIQSLEQRPYDEIRKFLKDFLKNQLNKSGVPKGLKNDIKSGYKISTGDKISSKSIKKAISQMVSVERTIFSAD